MPKFSKKVAEFFVRLAVDDTFAQTFATNKKKAFQQAGLSPLDQDEVNQTATFNVDVNIESKAGPEGAQQQTHTGSFNVSRKLGQ